nr:ABC transporter permease subunit [Streptomyces verrucosisporus]
MRRAPYLFLLPATALFLLFFALPVGYALHLSLRRVEVKRLGLGAGARQEVWAGLSNYTDALTDPELAAGALRVLGYGLIVVPVMLALALVFALMLDADRVRGRSFTRLAIFLPYALPGVIAALLWGFLYLPDVSPFHFVLGELGLPAPDLLDGGALYAALANIAVWGGTGEWRIFRSLALPMMLPGLVTVFLFQFVAIWNNFLLPYIMLGDDEKFPVTLGLFTLLQQGSATPALYTLVIAGALLAVLPLIALFLVVQRFWSLDLLSGAVKA